jgi:hypothetical protein
MRNIILVFIGILIFPGIALAQQIGPGVPAKNLPGNVATPNFGVGYTFRQAEYDGVELEEHRSYLHLGAVFGDEVTPNYEIFLRLGVARLEDNSGFEGDTELMYAAGVKSEFYSGKMFGCGGVLQGLYVEEYEDSVQVGNQVVDISLEDNVDVELAFPFHAKMNNWLIYAGPVVYWTASDVVAKAVSSKDGNIEEDHIAGGFGGLAFRTGSFSIEIEAKYKSDISVGGLITFTL